MPRAIIIKLKSEGVSEIKDAFRTVGQAIEEMERRAARAGVEGSAVRIKNVRREKDERENVLKQTSQAVDRAAREEARSAEKAEREKTREAEVAARFRERIRERSALMAGQWARREADTEIREAQRVHEARERYARGMLGQMGSSAKRSLGLISGAAHQVVGGVLQVGGGFSLTDSVSREVNMRRAAANISASSMADKDGKRVTTDEIVRRSRSIANENAMDPEEVIASIGKFKDLTGDTRRAMTLAPEIAKMATAFGGKPEDLMANAGNIAMSNVNMSNEDILRLGRVQTMQGMVGGVENKDMAQFGGRLVAGAGLFGGDRGTNIATMGAFAQVARQHGGADTASAATLAAQRFATDVVKHHADIEAAGVKVSDGKGQLRDANAIVKDMLASTGGDVFKMTDRFKLGDRSNKVITGMGDIYRQGGGGAAGQKALDSELAKFTTGVSDTETDERAKDRMAEVDARLTVAMNELKDAAGKELLPELVKLIPVLRDATPAFGRLVGEAVKFADWFVENPVKGIGAVIIAGVAKDVGGAMIGEAIKNTIARALAGSAGGAGGTGGAAGGGAAAGIALAGAGLIHSEKTGIDAVLSGQQEGQSATGRIAWMLKRGTAEQKAAAAKEVSDAEERSGGLRGIGRIIGETNKLGFSTINSLVTGERNTSAEQIKRTVADRELLKPENREMLTVLKALLEEAKRGNASGAGPRAGTADTANAPHRNLPMSHPARGGAGS